MSRPFLWIKMCAADIPHTQDDASRFDLSADA